LLIFFDGFHFNGFLSLLPQFSVFFVLGFPVVPGILVLHLGARFGVA
jgi:hypothetical protein